MKTVLAAKGDLLEPVSHVNYTGGLLIRASELGLIPDSKLMEIRNDLQKCALELAERFTLGRSNTISAFQAGAIYRSILLQIDAVLLMLPDDKAAIEMLSQKTVRELQTAGQQRVLTLYEQAKTDFRKAYDLMQPFMTDFYHQLLEKFALFCTKYDAQYNADKQIIDRIYPLLGEKQIPESGVIGAARYYAGLRMDAEFLHLFPQDKVLEIMKRHASRYLMTPSSIPDSVADLVFRQYLAAELAGEDGHSLRVSADAADRLTAEFADRSETDIRVEAELALSGFASEPALYAYLKEAVPLVIRSMLRALQNGKISQWLIVSA